MSRIERIEQRLREMRHPKLGAVDAPQLGDGDVLVTCAGFEERSLGALRDAVRAGASGFSVVGVRYAPSLSQNREEELARLCDECNSELSIVTYDRENPEGAGARIARAAASPKGSVVIDISGMSRLLIVQVLLEFGSSTWNFARVALLYYEPVSYSPSREQVTESLETHEFESLMFVSSGVLGVTVVPELSTVSMLGQPTHIIAFPSFNPRQLLAVHADMQGADYTLIHGKSPRPEHQWRTDAIRRLSGAPSRGADDIFASTLDYRETLQALVRVYEARSTARRLVVAPTGSKMQAVAVGIFRAFMADVQIVYPTPRTFTKPESYSIGCRQLYSLQLDQYSNLRKRVEP